MPVLVAVGRLDLTGTGDTTMRHHEEVARLVRDLAHKGEVIGPMHVAVDFSYDCENPQWATHVGRRHQHGEKFVSSNEGTPTAEAEVSSRCRKCGSCLRHRARIWTARALCETHMSARTWFGTLTLSPEWHTRTFLQACVTAKRRGHPDPEAMSEGERFVARDREIAPHISRMLKRIRKASGATLRHLIVAEAHANGLPHYHMLIHECRGDQPLRYDVLQHQWPLGFSKWKLVDDQRQASYLCKYLGKSAAARVRASLHYGNEDTVLKDIASSLEKKKRLA